MLGGRVGNATFLDTDYCVTLVANETYIGTSLVVFGLEVSKICTLYVLREDPLDRRRGSGVRMKTP